MRQTFSLLIVWIYLATVAGCSGKVEHDLDLAVKRAVEFADTTFVRHDIEKGYSLLTDNARSYVPFNKFEETVSMFRCNDYRGKVSGGRHCNRQAHMKS